MQQAEVRRGFLALGLGALLAGWGGGAWATALPAAEAKKVRAVVQAQLDAFAADDAKRAFSFAAPNIREMFGSPENFIAMVRAGYPVVYRPTSVAFMVPEAADGEVTQAVRMTDAQGGAWIAMYRLQRQHDKSWRISGCQVVASEGREA